MRFVFSLTFGVLICGLLSFISLAQEHKVYTDPVDRYQIELAGSWQEVSSTEGNGQRRLVIVFQGHSDQGELKIRKTQLGNVSFDQFIENDEAASLRYLPGFVKVKRQEPFGGGPLGGRMIEFDFKRFNNPRQGRYYYFDDKKGNVWILMFTGQPSVLKSIRPDTDQMARSFKPLG